jgi:hypothetical protein
MWWRIYDAVAVAARHGTAVLRTAVLRAGVLRGGRRRYLT